MNEKDVFINEMKKRTKKFAVDCILFSETIKSSKSSSVIIYQFIKAATSTAANYRAACLSRSKKEFFSKICIVVEEVDETMFWLEVIFDAQLYVDKKELKRLLIEADELTRIMSKAKSSSYS